MTDKKMSAVKNYLLFVCVLHVVSVVAMEEQTPDRLMTVAHTPSSMEEGCGTLCRGMRCCALRIVCDCNPPIIGSLCCVTTSLVVLVPAVRVLASCTVATCGNAAGVMLGAAVGCLMGGSIWCCGVLGNAIKCKCRPWICGEGVQ